MTELESRFHEAMLNIYVVARDECSYRPIRFLQKVRRDKGVAAARYWLAKSTPQRGLTTLHECGRIGISMEALVLKAEFAPLFTEEERNVARRRLHDLGYDSDALPSK